MDAQSLYYNRVHEGEYTSIPHARVSFPINHTSESVNVSRGSTPVHTASPRLEGSAMASDSNVDVCVPGKIENVPTLVHKWPNVPTILSMIPAPGKNVIFCGTQDSKILVLDLSTFQMRCEINAGSKPHTASVLCLALTTNEDYLFSAGSDSLVRVWDLSSIEEDFIPCRHTIYSLIDIGDVFSLAWSESLSTIFMGAQNASILWCRLSLGAIEKNNNLMSTVERLPHLRYDRFFDSKGPGGSLNVLQSKYQLLKSSTDSKSAEASLLEIGNEDNVRFAHNGYVYCMEIFDCRNSKHDFLNPYSDSYDNILISCGGDGNANVWGIKGNDKELRVKLLKSLENEESVLSMTIQDYYLYVGLSNSKIKVWDLMTDQIVRSFNFSRGSQNKDVSHSFDEVLNIGIYKDCIFKASNLGGLIKFTLKTTPPTAFQIDDQENEIEDGSKNSNASGTKEEQFDSSHYLGMKDNHPNEVLAVRIFASKEGRMYLLSGGRGLCLWDISSVEGNSIIPEAGLDDFNGVKDQVGKTQLNLTNEVMLKSLRKLICYRTISKLPSLYLEESRNCANYLSKLLVKLGACQNKLLPVPDGNPAVYASFKRNTKSSNETAPRVLWYAHYDVVNAQFEEDDWNTDPFHMTAKDGNLYGRGVSDNKGPLLAAVFAVAELYWNGELSCDVVFIIEGEEECGSVGFQKVITDNEELIGHIDWVMLSNSYWLDDYTPCLNYGLRGVMNASVSITSEKPDRHSGVDGGVSKEPTMDLVQLLSNLISPRTGRINLDGFYDDILPLESKEIEMFRKVKEASKAKDALSQDLGTLQAKWREPSLTVHKIEVSGPNNDTVIPQTAKASISIRIVPNQDLIRVKESVIRFLTEKFEDLSTENTLSIDIFHEAEPWLGDPSNLVYQILLDKIKFHWGPNVPEPLFIREGGSIPSIRFLEKCFNAPAVQIPCGQASDNAHLKDEKLRILNLYKLRNILKDTIQELGNK